MLFKPFPQRFQLIHLYTHHHTPPYHTCTCNLVFVLYIDLQEVCTLHVLCFISIGPPIDG